MNALDCNHPDELNMKTAFQVGDYVKAKIATQGLRAGETYEVMAVNERPTAFGNFVEYRVGSLRRDGERGFEWCIVNAHIMLERVVMVTPKNADETDGRFGLWVTEASDLRIPPGRVPERLQTTIGNGHDFILIDTDCDKWSYVQDLGCTNLTVWND